MASSGEVAPSRTRDSDEPRRLVVDASVAVKWLIPEAQAENARWVLQAAGAGAVRLVAPDLWTAEVANVLWRRARGAAAELAPAEAAEMVDHLLRFMEPNLHACAPIARAAFAVAAETGATVYDALYVALALREDAVFVTADERLVRRLRGTPYEARIASLRRFGAGA